MTIRELRVQKRLTQLELAKKCGVTQAYISQIENKDPNLSIRTLHKLADALEVSITTLIETYTRCNNERYIS